LRRVGIVEANNALATFTLAEHPVIQCAAGIAVATAANTLRNELEALTTLVLG